MPDKYTYPDSEVLRNFAGITDQAQLDLAEQDLANIRLVELLTKPVAGKFDLRHLQEIHRRILGDLYEWAGHLRIVDTQAMGTGVAHCRPEFIPSMAEGIFSSLRREHWLKSHSQEDFTRRLAWYWGELSALHPFRDGNTRSQSVFIDQLSKNAGWLISWEALDLDRLKEARVIAIAKGSEELEAVLKPAVSAT